MAIGDQKASLFQAIGLPPSDSIIEFKTPPLNVVYNVKITETTIPLNLYGK